MDRDEILRRSRAEKEDEGNTFLENKGRRWGMVGFCAMTIVLLVFNLATARTATASWPCSGAILLWRRGRSIG